MLFYFEMYFAYVTQIGVLVLETNSLAIFHCSIQLITIKILNWLWKVILTLKFPWSMIV